VNIPKKK